MHVRARLRYLHMSPPKVRRVARLIQGMPVQQAQNELAHRRELSAKPLEKLLKSAVANATNISDAKPEVMQIVSMTVTEGPKMKRFRPVSRGMAHGYAKRMSHVTVVLDVPGERKETEKAEAPVKLKPGEKIEEVPEQEEDVQTSEQAGPQRKRTTPGRDDVRKGKQRAGAPGLKKFFRRKSI